MLSGVSVMYLRIYHELILISYHEQKKGKNILRSEGWDFQVKEKFTKWVTTSAAHHDSDNLLLQRENLYTVWGIPQYNKP